MYMNFKKIMNFLKKFKPSHLKNSLFYYLAKNISFHLKNIPIFHGQHPVIIGSGVSLCNTILNSRSGKIEIGNNVIFGHDAMLLTGLHEYEGESPTLKTNTEANRDIYIGNNVWIASGVIVIGPVRIGDRAVIGAGAVVTKDVAEDSLVVGSQAVVKKKLR